MAAPVQTINLVSPRFGLAMRLRNRGTSKRSKALPLGDGSSSTAEEGNTMVSRCVVLMLLAAARGIWIIWEQPRGSLMEHHPAIQKLFKHVRFWRQHVCLGLYGAATQKATWLYSSQRLRGLSHPPLQDRLQAASRSPDIETDESSSRYDPAQSVA